VLVNVTALVTYACRMLLLIKRLCVLLMNVHTVDKDVL